MPPDVLPPTAAGAVSVALPGDAGSARAARRFVRHVLDDAGRPEWVETAELLCSEVVSNVVLHARSDLVLTVHLADEHALVEVRDFSPTLPSPREYSEQATTGRGMTLVAALSLDHGISDAGPHGKTVWFTVGGSPAEQSEDDLLAAWDDAHWDLDEVDAAAHATGRDIPGMTVRLLALPPALWLAARQHHDALVRELVLYAAEHGEPEVDTAAADRARFTISNAVLAAIEDARRAGLTRRILPPGHPSPLEDVPEPIDLDLFIPAGLGPAFAALQDTLDAAEELARTGRLLASPGLPEIIAVRDWCAEQVLAQLAGVTPSPWPGTDQERFTRVVHARDAEPDLTDRDLSAVRDSERRVVAADTANRIVAISRPLASLVGWDVDDLVGRRVVTLIPPSMREAHVAGFTRALTTGEHHVLDVPLTLPVLHKDGHDVTCTFLVQQAPTRNGRAVYLAWIEPVDKHLQ